MPTGYNDLGQNNITPTPPDPNAQDPGIYQTSNANPNDALATSWTGDKGVFPLNAAAYLNPVGNQALNWQQGMTNYLGATTGNAPQMGNTSAGSAALSGQAQIGQTALYGGAGITANQANQSYAQQGALANQLALQSQGLGPSIAQVTAQNQAQSNLAGQMALLGSQRGSSNPALAAYQAQGLGAQVRQQAARQAVLGRTQEALAAQNQYGTLLGNMNTEGQGLATNQAQLQQQGALASAAQINAQNTAQANLSQQNAQYNVGNQNAFSQLNAQLGQQTNQSNLGAAAQQNAINATQYNNMMQLLQANNMAQYQGQMALQQQTAADDAAARGLTLQGTGQNIALAGASAAGLSGLGGIVAQATSDKRSKKNIYLGSHQLNTALENLYNKQPKMLRLL